MALLQALWTSCRPQQSACCSCRDEDELLTLAWRENLEKQHVAASLSEADPAFCSTNLPISSRDHATPGVAPRLESKSAEPEAPDWAKKPPQPTAHVAVPENAAAGNASGAPTEGSSLRAAFATRGGPPELEAPPEFDVLRLAGRGVATSQGTTQTAEEQRRLLQTSLKAFTRSFVKGVCMRVLLDDGRTLFTEASLDSELTHLVLHMTNAQRPVALRSIESICAPDDVRVITTNQAFLDHRCSTLLLRDGQFLTFVFDSLRTREYFEMSMKVILIAKGFSAEDAGSATPPAALAHVAQPPVGSLPMLLSTIPGGVSEDQIPEHRTGPPTVRPSSPPSVCDGQSVASPKTPLAPASRGSSRATAPLAIREASRLVPVDALRFVAAAGSPATQPPMVREAPAAGVWDSPLGSRSSSRAAAGDAQDSAS